ncbi:MAG TPA: redoxin domain-containing protein [Methanomassiliicoccales archaeon]|nr:redoxin domain-containing protein [Methanomassiliicoccales archaeon]
MSEQDIQVGRRAPDFRLREASEEAFHLYGELRQGPLLLLFYPNDFGVVCSLEMKEIESMLPSIISSGLRVVAVSRNSTYTHRQFKESLGLTFRLLADEEGEVSMRYAGLLADGLLKGMTRRAVFIVDSEGIIRYRWISREMAMLPPFDELSEAIKGLAGSLSR